MTFEPGLEHWMGRSFFVGSFSKYANRPVLRSEMILDVAGGLTLYWPSLAPLPITWSSLCLQLFLLVLSDSCFVHQSRAAAGARDSHCIPESSEKDLFSLGLAAALDCFSPSQFVIHCPCGR
jgi:hypothetical protein